MNITIEHNKNYRHKATVYLRNDQIVELLRLQLQLQNPVSTVFGNLTNTFDSRCDVEYQNGGYHSDVVKFDVHFSYIILSTGHYTSEKILRHELREALKDQLENTP